MTTSRVNGSTADAPTVATALVILGPTASGKSDVAMAWCRRSAIREIVAVDSMQVYRGMDIGTAKPTADDRAAVVHHGLDLAAPSEDFTVAAFAEAARQSLADVERRHHEAVLVAGTGLYLRAITDLMEIPGQWPELRAALYERANAEGSHVLHAELAERDPAAAAKIEPSNTRRIVRALEVTLGSGRPFSSFGEGLNVYPPVPFRQFGLRWPRSLLRRRIAQRVETMIERGLVAEVSGLCRTGLSATARQALGYKEIIEHLDGHTSLDEATARIVVRTQQFAVRQERWFRRDPRIRWIDIDEDPVAETLVVLEDEAHT